MPTVPLPDNPSFEQLRKQAKDLRKTDGVSLSAAQLAIARYYGFASWTRLKRHLEVVAEYRRDPDLVPASEDAADEFLRLACLSYGGDDPSQWADARRLVTEHPELGTANIFTAAATADAAATRAFVQDDASRARQTGGPFGWEPLFYLAYARHDPDVALDAVLNTARALLAHGADPNAGYLWHGLPTPFTVLTGLFGEGELGPVRQPRHPHSIALATLLLQHGADPNDGQTLYNRQFRPDNDHLVVLLAHGLGTGDGGPWRRRLGDAVDSPAELVLKQLQWAIVHDQRDRVQLIVAHDVDFQAQFGDGRTPVELALLNGNRDVAEMLVARGASRPELTPTEAFVAAALAGDRALVASLVAEHPRLVDDVKSERPGLVVWAAAAAPPDAVRLLLERGFDVNAPGRTDVPVEQGWETALHQAAAANDVELARLLLEFGADPDLHDHRFDNTPLGWARHFGNDEMIALLEPMTN